MKAYYYCGLCGWSYRREESQCKCGSHYFTESRFSIPRGIIPAHQEDDTWPEYLALGARLRSATVVTARRHRRPAHVGRRSE